MKLWRLKKARLKNPKRSKKIMEKLDINKLAQLNEATWIKLGNLAAELLPFEKAINCYEMALRSTPFSVEALNGLATCYRNHEMYGQAVEVYQRYS